MLNFRDSHAYQLSIFNAKRRNAAWAAQDGVTVRFKCPIFKYFFNFIFFPFLFFIKSFECNKSHRPALTHTRSARRAIECSRNKVKSTRGEKEEKKYQSGFRKPPNNLQESKKEVRVNISKKIKKRQSRRDAGILGRGLQKIRHTAETRRSRQSA